jgi:hypothetical protein
MTISELCDRRKLRGLDNARTQDLRGKKFGKLTPIEIDPIKTGKSIFWKCRCDCRRIKSVRTIHLTKGRVMTCGKCGRLNKGNRNKAWKGFGEISGTYFNSIRNGAIARNLEFSITIEQLWELFLQQQRKCYLSDISLTPPMGRFNEYIDRIDSSKGYIQGNVKWVHKDINLMKQAFTKEHFILLCKKIAWNNRIRRKGY